MTDWITIEGAPPSRLKSLDLATCFSCCSRTDVRVVVLGLAIRVPLCPACVELVAEPVIFAVGVTT